MSSHRVLLVSAEAALVSGLRRMLRWKGDWELVIADSAERALVLLVTGPVDVVVAGRYLTGMDGDEFLWHVRRLYPSTARVMVSADADVTDVVSAAGVAQVLLSWPRDAGALVRSIEAVLAARDLGVDERLRGILGDVEALPAPPSVHLRLVEVSARPNSAMSDVVAVLESDLALCAEILKLVNSAYFGLSRRIESVDRAVGLLGLDTIHALALSGKVFGADLATPRDLDVVQLRRTAMRAAGFARAIAASERWTPESVGRAFLAALLRDVGLLALASDAAGYERVRVVPVEDPWARSQAELDAFGCTVPEASAFILGQWGITQPVVEAIACQPAQPDDMSVTPIAHVVGFAHLRAQQDHVVAEVGTSPWHEVRNQRWNDICEATGSLSEALEPAR